MDRRHDCEALFRQGSHQSIVGDGLSPAAGAEHYDGLRVMRRPDPQIDLAPSGRRQAYDRRRGEGGRLGSGRCGGARSEHENGAGGGDEEHPNGHDVCP